MKQTNKAKRLGVSALAAVSFLIGQASYGSLFFWNNGGGDGGLYNNPLNWGGGPPGAADLAVHNSGLPAVQINGNWSVDSFRISNGGSAVHTAGTMTIANGFAGDNGLWVGEFGPAPTSYTLSGGTVQINDPADGFMIARAGGSIGTFTVNSGIVNNTVGDTHIGLDGGRHGIKAQARSMGPGCRSVGSRARRRPSTLAGLPFGTSGWCCSGRLPRERHPVRLQHHWPERDLGNRGSGHEGHCQPDV